MCYNIIIRFQKGWYCDMANKEMMIKEAIQRMKMLGILPQTIKEFEENSIVSKSTYGGILLWLDDEEKKIVEAFEKDNNFVVYHAIKCTYRVGDDETMTCLDLLYVSSDEEEWEAEKADIRNNCMFAYTISDFCKEFGAISVKSVNGGLLRMA